ncbi:hypothetical protein ACFOUP_02260 [Belliella kenyensis]|uniref:Uncharacterized protein n=1 Tax=Belliella kenyensis TaxID=1472724 RepID=A0ABV8EHT5_9BACT|nr:hypothetical protein [Belliella kenyensis]MCH7400980.1 hypothetical protein [Belliella kenyensis]MDN3603978.1 hypothetical protein [Belliella kenyensis]
MKKHLKPLLLTLLIAYAVGEGLKLVLGSEAVTGGHLVVMSVSVYFYLRRYPFPSARTVKNEKWINQKTEE